MNWIDATPDNPCPRCGYPRWCAVSADGKRCICMRSPSASPTRNGGWLHYLPPGAVAPVAVRKAKQYLQPAQVKASLARLDYCPDNDMLVELARLLRLRPTSLLAMRGGYAVGEAALAFPMYGSTGTLAGVRYRRRDGRKWSLKGGREGVFLSSGFNPNAPVFVTEGPTDAAALIEAGVANVIGRPNCSGGVQIVHDLLGPTVPVVVLADPNEVGTAGAERLSMTLPNPCIVLVSDSDVRDFVVTFRDRKLAAEAIVKTLKGHRGERWQVLSRNLPGQLFPWETVDGRNSDRHHTNEPGEHRTERRHSVRPAAQVSGGV